MQLYHKTYLRLHLERDKELKNTSELTRATFRFSENVWLQVLLK